MEQALDSGIKPTQIGFLGFTRRARHEALSRAKTRFGYEERDLPYVKTIHSICFKALGLSREQVMDDRKMQAFAKWSGYEITPRGAIYEPVEGQEGEWEQFGPIKTEGDRLISWHHVQRQKIHTLETGFTYFSGESDKQQAFWFVEHYTAYKRSQGLMDFTDFLTLYSSVGQPLPIKVLFVDEAQDLSPLQWKAVDLMATTADTEYDIGDDDQAIFNWAGAESSEFLSRRADEELVLPHSYRLPSLVHGLALDIIRNVKGRKDKRFEPAGHTGSLHYAESAMEEIPEDGNVMVLYRNHYLSSDIVSDLNERGIPYTGAGSPFSAKRAEVFLRAIHAWETLRSGLPVEMGELMNAFEFVPSALEVVDRKKLAILKSQKQDYRVTTPAQTPIKTMIPWIDAMTKIPKREIIDAVVSKRGVGALLEKPRITLSTIHQAKGGEADTVVVLPDMGFQTFRQFEEAPDEEHRVFYVAVTRAKRRLIIRWAQGNQYYPYVFNERRPE